MKSLMCKSVTIVCIDKKGGCCKKECTPWGNTSPAFADCSKMLEFQKAALAFPYLLCFSKVRRGSYARPIGAPSNTWKDTTHTQGAALEIITFFNLKVVWHFERKSNIFPQKKDCFVL